MADRLADYASLTTGNDHRDLLRESARVVAQAHYRTNPEGD
jgi:hypothetical protein